MLKSYAYFEYKPMTYLQWEMGLGGHLEGEEQSGDNIWGSWVISLKWKGDFCVSGFSHQTIAAKAWLLKALNSEIESLDFGL